MAEGWRCPICESVYAPWMAQCTRCPPKVMVDRMTTPHETATNWVPSLTGRCPSCGGFPNAPMGTGCPSGSHYSIT